MRRDDEREFKIGEVVPIPPALRPDPNVEPLTDAEVERIRDFLAPVPTDQGGLMPEARLQRTREAYPGGDSVADAFRGRWCDDCDRRVGLAYPEGGEWRPFDPARDPAAFCTRCYAYLGDYVYA